MDLVIEILLEIYLELMLLVIPEKNVTKRQRRIAKAAAIGMIVVLAVLVIWGAALIVDDGNLLGILPIAIAAAASLVQIVAGIVLFKKHH